MTNERKYAALPDLDSAPDVYETPDLVEDKSSASNGENPESPASSYKDLDGDNEEYERIDRHILRPDQARSHFARSRVDARLADFSGRLGDTSTKGYRVTSRRRRRKGGYDEYEGRPDSDEEDETIDQRVARLRREVEEVRLEQQKASAAGTDDQNDTLDVMGQLSGVLDELDQGRQDRKRREAADEDEKADAPALGPGNVPVVSADFRQTLTKATALETRLASLESGLGMSTTTTEISEKPQKSILAAISMLETQLSIVSATTAPTLDTLSRQINSLIADLEKATEARRAAGKPDESTMSARPRSALGEPTVKSSEAEQQAEKIKELYKALPQFQRVSPVLPAVIERLRSLRVLHEEASSATSAIDQIEQRQAQVNSEIGLWRAGLERVEEAILKAGEKADANKAAIERWVKELEDRAQKLE